MLQEETSLKAAIESPNYSKGYSDCSEVLAGIFGEDLPDETFTGKEVAEVINLIQKDYETFISLLRIGLDKK